MLEARAGKFSLFHYDPSLVAAVIFTVLFALTTILHLYQIIRTRTWFFIAFFCGGLCEVVGYVGRILSAQETPDWTRGPFIMYTVLSLVAPALFAASIYMELGRIVGLVEGDCFLFIRRKWLTATFVTGDVLSFFMQGGGGGLMGADTPKTRDTGSKIIVGGLLIQIIFFAIFVLAATLFHIRVNKQPTPRSTEVPWRKHMFALYSVSILILIRSVFRVVEFLQGFDGYIFSHEVYLYVFDAVLMLAAMMIMNWIHPSEIKMLTVGSGKAASGFRMT